MGKFPFKRPRIISKKFPNMTSSIDGVTKSLNDLIFSYRDNVEKALQKKHLMMAMSSLVLLIVLGSFISPKGKAESSIFYPETCLGGWVNPQHAQGEEQTTSNGDESQFTKENSAILPKNTNAEMYCGNFKGKVNADTKPTKILVSLALTKGADYLLIDTIVSDSFSSSSKAILDSASSTDVSFTLIASSTGATSTSLTASITSSTSTLVIVSTASSTSTAIMSTSTTDGTTTAIAPSATDTSITQSGISSNTIPVVSPVTPPSILNGIVESFKETLHGIFGGSTEKPQQTDTVVVPPPTPPADTAPVPPVTSPLPTPDAPPTSMLPVGSNSFLSSLLYFFSEKAFAEVTKTTTSTDSSPVVTGSSSDFTNQLFATDTINGATTSTSSLISASSTDNATSTSTSTSIGNASTTNATTTDENEFQNNFLEVFYTFDGVTWISLGELNEISMKYRTFEIPVTASTSWNDMGQLQIKVIAKKHLDETPTVYLDGIKVEVLYESTLAHIHPDFARDTILKDEIVDGVRVVTIINNETKMQEVWYMYLETATSTLLVGASTTDNGTTTDALLLSSSTLGTSTENVSQHLVLDGSTTLDSNATTTALPVVDLLRHTWKKFEVKNITLISTAELVETIKKKEIEDKKKEEEKIKIEEEKDVLPDFASDTIKKMKGVFSYLVLVQIERVIGTSTDTGSNTKDELWVYNMEKNTEERIGKETGTSTDPITIGTDSPLGIKGGYLFWISENKSTVYAYSFENKTVTSQTIPTFDGASGERAEIHFAEIPWKVIVSNEGFSFYSPSTGEVFSDEDSKVVESLRAKMGLDSILDKDELSNLNLPVSADHK